MHEPQLRKLALHTTRGTIDFPRVQHASVSEVTIVAMGARDAFPIPFSSFIYASTIIIQTGNDLSAVAMRVAIDFKGGLAHFFWVGPNKTGLEFTPLCSTP